MYLEVSAVSQGWSFLSEAHLQCKRKRCLMMDMCDDLVKFIANELNPKTTICFSFHLRWYSGILFDTHLLHVECGILHYVYQEFRMCSVLVHESRLWNTCWQILYVTVNLSQIDSVLTWPLSDPPLHCLCLNWLDRQIVSFVFVQDISNYMVALVKHIYIHTFARPSTETTQFVAFCWHQLPDTSILPAAWLKTTYISTRTPWPCMPIEKLVHQG